MSALRKARLARALRGLLLLSLTAALVTAGLGAWTLFRQDRDLSALMRLPVQQLSKSADFRLKRIVLRGHQRMESEALLNALSLQSGETLALIDLASAKLRLESLEWIKSASLRRVFPDSIEARLQEETPFAMWQRRGHLFLVNHDGVAFLDLDDNDIEAFTHLPYLVGVGALDEGIALLETLDDYPDMKEKMVSAVWVGERRWDLHLHNDIRVRLPEEGLHRALAQLQRLHVDYDIFRRDIRSIDLRLRDRVGFHLGETAVLPEAVEAQYIPLPRGDG